MARKDDTLIIRGLYPLCAGSGGEEDYVEPKMLDLEIEDPESKRCFSVMIVEPMKGEVALFFSEDGYATNDSGQALIGNLGYGLGQAIGSVFCFLEEPKGKYSDEWRRAHECTKDGAA